MCKQREEEIEILRRHLADVIQQKGYTAEETIKVSQQLDLLLNQWQSTE